MEDNFKPNSLTINKLFTDAEALYQIPRYQRPYKWGDDQVDKLWDDLWESYSNEETNYFLGSLITAKAAYGTNYFDVVDGQQRLTTLTILFAVVRDLYPNINEKLSETDPFAVDMEKLKNSLQVNEKFGRLRLFTHSNHQSDFDKLIIKGDTTLLSKPYKKDLRKDEEPKWKFQNTAFEFAERLKNIGEKEAGVFINYIFNKVRIIRIDCSDVSFAIKLFQVLNARGLDLTNADLIKSFLLSRLHELYDQSIIQKKEDQFLQDWIACEKIASETEISLNDLLVIYEYYLLAGNPRKSLYDELVIQFASDDPLDIIEDFKQFCKHYSESIYYSEEPLIFGFYHLRWGMYWRTVLISALHTGYPDFKEFARVVRDFYYLHWISGYTLTRVKQVSFNLVKWVKEKKPINEIKRELNKISSENNIQNRLVEALDGDIYNDAWSKTLYILIEYNQLDNPSYIWAGNRDIHLEHILPQGFEKIYGWKHIIDDEKLDGNDFVHKLGNMTLLSGKKNIEASNNPFDQKIDAYSGKGRYKEDNEKITSFRITQNIVDDFYAGTFEKQWDFNSIEKRRVWLIKEIENLFSVDLSKMY